MFPLIIIIIYIFFLIFIRNFNFFDFIQKYFIYEE